MIRILSETYNIVVRDAAPVVPTVAVAVSTVAAVPITVNWVAIAAATETAPDGEMSQTVGNLVHVTVITI